MSEIRQSSSRGKLFLPGFFVCGFAICNFLVPLMLELTLTPDAIQLMSGVYSGSMLGQLCLLAIWGVLGPLGAPSRLITTLAIGAFLIASGGVGSMIADPSVLTIDGPVTAFLVLPLYLLALQSPLWGLKLVTGGRIIHVGAQSRQSETVRRQFGLRDLMGGTLVIAVALSLASSGIQMSEDRQAEGWGPILSVCLFFAVLSTFVTLPCLWAGMIAKNKGAATVIIVIYALLVPVLYVVVVWLIVGGGIPGEVPVLFFAHHVPIVAVILGTLHVARLCGYTFISRRRPQPVLPTDCPFAVGDDSCGGTQAVKTSAGDKPLDPDQPFEQGAT